MSVFSRNDLYKWCKIPAQELMDHPDRKAPFRICKDSQEMGQIMARELVDALNELLYAELLAIKRTLGADHESAIVRELRPTP